MGPLPLILLALTAAPHAQAAAQDDAAFELRAGEFIQKAGAAFVAHKQGAPLLEQAVPLPPAPRNPAQTPSFDLLKALHVSASRAQEGCQAPCTDPAEIALYRGKIELIAQTKLGLDAAGVRAAVENYLPRGVPRIRTAAVAGDRASHLLEAEVVEKMLKTAGVAADVRRGLSRKAIALAEALGRTQEVTADAQGFVVMPGGERRQMTAEQLAALNRIPAAQASYLRRLATAPPPPTVQERSDAAMKEADKVIAENPGRVREAANFWVRESQNTNANPLWRGYSYFNRGLLAITGLVDIEESAGRLGYASASSDVTTRRTVWEGVKMTGNIGMFAANFVGLSGGAAVVRSARAIDNPVVIEGVEQLSRAATQRVVARSADVTETVTTALARGGNRNYRAATDAMNDYSRTNLGGVIRVERGGKIGQADLAGGKIKYNPLVGEPHEFAHASQMFLNRANALEITAQRVGKTAAQLNPAEVEQALALAKRFEKGYYMHHEAQAMRSSGVLSLFPGSNYGAKLAANGDELTRAMLGTPAWNFTRGQKAYGALSGLGNSQGRIAASLVPLFNLPIAKDGVVQGIDAAADAISPLLPAPTSGSR
ncbi:MAG: hypothetical protein Q8T11_13885 [Elusimicrobiota bacterium]|nr:hypothetical protein [Elusimicrobiota bacterium]